MLLDRNIALYRNLLLRSLPSSERHRLAAHAEAINLTQGDTVFEPGHDVTSVIFPFDGTIISLRIPLEDGRAIETATVGREGALGSILSQGYLPSFTRAVVQMGGEAVRIPSNELHVTEFGSLPTGNTLVRYADCLLAQVLQSVACNAVHSLEQRCARRLLTLHARFGHKVLPVTQEFLAEMLGVQRSYLTRLLINFERQGIIKKGRGKIEICDPEALQATSCECHGRIRNHFSHVLGASFTREGAFVALDPEVAGEAPNMVADRV